MPWAVIIAKRAEKELQRLPRRDAERILGALEGFRKNPYAGDIEKIEGEDRAWRRRIGSYRIFYELYSGDQIIYVVRIERRTSTTY